MGADQEQPAARSTLEVFFRRRVGHGVRVEAGALVRDDDLDARGSAVELDEHRGTRGKTAVPVPEGIGERLVEREPDGEHRGLGVAKVLEGLHDDRLRPLHLTRLVRQVKDGVATGLVWTFGGGDITIFEVSLLPGKGGLTMTGNLGEVMQESAQAALSYVRSRADDFGVPSDDFENYDIHVHVPEGAVPKEGPSAGITLAIAMISALTERKIRHEFGMTGEITLRGKVLPIGGVKEKVMAARRANLKNIILPAHNQKDLVDIPKKALRGVNVHLVDDMQQVIDLVLLEPPAEGRKRDAKKRDQDDEDDEDQAADDV
ncbi:MAG: hypothetical protein DYG92_12970 [Leptolyngbya sp. PLA1]|nr:hypothetical protein [Leptolyngbya sp. PLA1]